MSRQASLHKLSSAAPVIAPSMLKCDFGDLASEVSTLDDAGSQVLHWDVMDGHFVPNLSYGALTIAPLRHRTQQIFDAHLMISEPERYLDSFLEAGCDCITFHIEAVPDPIPLLEKIQQADCVAGLALNPGTPVEKIEQAIPYCDLVLVMSVEPGFGGQSFIPSAVEKIKRIRQTSDESLLISVDGGISPETIGPCAEAGANLFVAGSTIFETNDYRQAIEEMHNIAEHHRPPLSC
ncbi:MAG TPA: ribulose-phosphate 3-epimerase [Planctomycetaceae bacterium]|nr:ribulose-phosphate 3-epimerase [Planctomycetaceae bacterium]